MPHYRVTRRLPIEAPAIYDIIADVASYPEFLPLCEGARVWNARTDAKGRHQFQAELLIVYRRLGLREKFVSEVTCDSGRLAVMALSNRHPVKHLDNKWQVIPIGPALSDIEFTIDYEMSSRVLQFAMKSAFDYAMRKVMAAFETRAHALNSAQK